jgi:hypothetical protein
MNRPNLGPIFAIRTGSRKRASPPGSVTASSEMDAGDMLEEVQPAEEAAVPPEGEENDEEPEMVIKNPNHSLSHRLNRPSRRRRKSWRWPWRNTPHVRRRNQMRLQWCEKDASRLYS